VLKWVFTLSNEVQKNKSKPPSQRHFAKEFVVVCSLLRGLRSSFASGSHCSCPFTGRTPSHPQLSASVFEKHLPLLIFYARRQALRGGGGSSSRQK
jgi:hypothetical protein